MVFYTDPAGTWQRDGVVGTAASGLETAACSSTGGHRAGLAASSAGRARVSGRNR